MATQNEVGDKVKCTSCQTVAKTACVVNGDPYCADCGGDAYVYAIACADCGELVSEVFRGSEFGKVCADCFRRAVKQRRSVLKREGRWSQLELFDEQMFDWMREQEDRE